MRRMSDDVNLALTSRESHAQAVMRIAAGAVVAQEARRSQFGSGKQGIAGASIHEQGRRGSGLRMKTDAVKLALSRRPLETEAVMSSR
jgi:hypothetical protein